MSSLEVVIDGQHLTSLYSPGDVAPIYLATVDTLFHISTQTQSKLDAGAYAVTQTWTIRDNYSTLPVTPNDPVVLITFPSGTFKNEDMVSQIKCQYTTPTNSKFIPLDLKFDAQFGVWSYHFKELVDVEAYSVKIACAFSVKQLTVQGIDVTPNKGLKIEIIDLADKKRYTTSISDNSGFFQTYNLATINLAGLGKTVMRCTLQGTTLLKTGQVIPSSLADIKTATSAAGTSILDPDNALIFKATTPLSPSLTLPSHRSLPRQYFDVTAQETLYNSYYSTGSKNVYTGLGDISYSPGSFNTQQSAFDGPMFYTPSYWRHSAATWTQTVELPWAR